MKKEEIQPWDFQRILFGQAPEGFLVEVLLRAVFMYLLLMVVLKALGKRMDGQLTLTELAVMVTFGAIVAVPMQIPDRGLLLGIVAMLCVMAFQRGVNWLTVKSPAFEDTTQGVSSTLVKDGRIELDELYRAGLSRQNLFAMIRQQGIFNLAKVKRFYFEACGVMSIYEERQNKPGLSLLPPGEFHVLKSQGKVDHAYIACSSCGNVIEKQKENQSCAVCGKKEWIEAIV
jgi:uncharacterized membrane protein YcaP (DUF421 family)